MYEKIVRKMAIAEDLDNRWDRFIEKNIQYKTTMQKKVYWVIGILYKTCVNLFERYYIVDTLFLDQEPEMMKLEPPGSKFHTIVAKYKKKYCGVDKVYNLFTKENNINKNAPWVDCLLECGMPKSDVQYCRYITELYSNYLTEGKIITKMWMMSRTGFRLLFNLLYDHIVRGNVHLIPLDRNSFDMTLLSLDRRFPSDNILHQLAQVGVYHCQCCNRICNCLEKDKHGCLAVTKNLSKGVIECTKHKKRGPVWIEKEHVYKYFRKQFAQKVTEFVETKLGGYSSMIFQKYGRILYGDHFEYNSKINENEETSLESTTSTSSKNSNSNPIHFNNTQSTTNESPKFISMRDVYKGIEGGDIAQSIKRNVKYIEKRNKLLKSESNQVLKTEIKKKKKSRTDITKDVANRRDVYNVIKTIMPKELRSHLEKQSRSMLDININKQTESRTEVHVYNIIQGMLMKKGKGTDSYESVFICHKCVAPRPLENSGYRGIRHFCHDCLKDMGLDKDITRNKVVKKVERGRGRPAKNKQPGKPEAAKVLARGLLRVVTNRNDFEITET